MKKYSIEQSGRSMIEMLGVLAIVGVLSVAGIAGYSKAMGKFKINKAMDQISTLSANIKTMYANLGIYTTLTNDIAYKLNLFPDEMVKNCTESSFLDNFISIANADGEAAYADCVTSGINGKVTVDGTNGSSFTIEMDNVNKEACIAFVSGEWGGAAGFKSLKVEASTAGASLMDFLINAAHAEGIEILPGTTSADLFTALAECGTCGSGDCKATWTFL